MKSIQLQTATTKEIALFKLGAASVYQAARIPPKEADRRFEAQLAKIAKDMTMDSALEANQPAATVKKDDGGKAQDVTPDKDKGIKGITPAKDITTEHVLEAGEAATPTPDQAKKEARVAKIASALTLQLGLK